MLADTIVLKSMQAVARRIFKIVEEVRSIDHFQADIRSILYLGRELSTALTQPNAFGLTISEASNHWKNPVALG